MTRRLFTILIVLLSVPAVSGLAAERAWIMSVPYAISGEQVYNVRILEIDGEPQRELLRYAVEPGRRELTVQLLLDLEWEPDLRNGEPLPPIKRIEIPAEGGRSYLLAGKVNVDAPVEAQLDQSYWEPIVYAVQ